MIELLRAKDCAVKAAVSKATWWNWVREGKAPEGTKLSKQVTVWRSDEFEEFINRLAPRKEISHAS